MSYNRPPSPIHPKSSSTQTSSILAMAATQLPPLGPHIFPQPIQPARRFSQTTYPTAISPYSLPPFAEVQHDFQRHSTLNASVAVRPVHVPSPQILSKKRRSAVPVASLLQSEPCSPPNARPATSPRNQFHPSPQSAFSPHEFITTPPVQSPVYHTARHENPGLKRRYSQKDDRSSAPLPPSPSYVAHRSSVTSHYSSRTASSERFTGSSITQQPTVRLEMVSRPQNLSSRYRLTIRQQPIAARACGFGERDRRVIDPPPILQLSLADFDPFSSSDASELRWPLNVVHCALYSVPPPSSATSTSVDVTSVPDPNNSTRLSRRLMGTLVATPFIGIDPNAPITAVENARIGSFFIFHDLSCRQNGLYKLRFTLMHVNVELAVTGGRGDVVSSVESDVFEVFSAKDFPGMRASTTLTKDLKRQGANIQIKKGNEGKGAKKGQKRSSTDTEESASNASDEDSRKAQPRRKRKKQ